MEKMAKSIENGLSMRIHPEGKSSGLDRSPMDRSYTQLKQVERGSYSNGVNISSHAVQHILYLRKWQCRISLLLTEHARI